MAGRRGKKVEHNTDEDRAGYLSFRYNAGTEKTPLVIASVVCAGISKEPISLTLTTSALMNLNLQVRKGTIEGVDWNRYSEIKFAVFNASGSTVTLNYNASERSPQATCRGSIHPQFEVLAGVRAEHTNQGYYLQHVVQGFRTKVTSNILMCCPAQT